MTVDWTGSSPAVAGPLNAVRAITESATWYVARCVTGADVPANSGAFAPVRVVVPRGSILDAEPPHAVAGGNVETSQRIVDVVLGALAQALPDLIPAASLGTMNNLTIGGRDPERGAPFAYYETVGGGAGAGPDWRRAVGRARAHDQHPQHPRRGAGVRLSLPGAALCPAPGLWRAGDSIAAGTA